MTHLTAEPHLVPGYQGHCSQYNKYCGGTYAHITHKALLSPCIPHGSDINLTPIHITKDLESPSKEEKRVLKDRQTFVDAVFKNPIIPGYTGCVPRLRGQVGKRYIAAATSALVEHEELMEVKRCQHRTLMQRNVLQSSQGLYYPKMNERMISNTRYHAPLNPVNPKAQAVKLNDYCSPARDKIPYSKFSTPHFKENDDEDKWIINGYGGHIPNARFLIGCPSKSLSRAALNQFSDGVKHRRLQRFCTPTDAECIDDSCPRLDCNIYRSENSMIPKYTGHIPGRMYQVGKRDALEMMGAKNWIREQKILKNSNAPPACGAQWR